MVRLLFDGVNIIVAILTDMKTGVLSGEYSNIIDSIGAVVAILTERFRYK
jgi:hypothetical protein